MLCHEDGWVRDHATISRLHIRREEAAVCEEDGLGLLDLGWDRSGRGGLLGPSSLNGEARQAKSEANEFSNLRRKYDTSDGEDAIGIKQVAVAV